MGNIKIVQNLIEKSCKYSTIMLMLVSVPLCYEMRYIMRLWLGIVPDYAPVFCTILLFQNVLSVISVCIIMGIHATGNILRLSMYNGVVNFVSLPVLYIILKYCVDSPVYAYIVSFFTVFITIIVNGYILKKQVPEIQIMLIIKPVLIAITVCVFTALPVVYIRMLMPESFIRLLAVTMLYVPMTAICLYFFSLTKAEKAFIKNFLPKR